MDILIWPMYCIFACMDEKKLAKEIGQKIYMIRGFRVMLDSDLAGMYGVETKVLNQSVRRNIDRFPQDFMFQVSENELSSLRSQFVTLEGVGRGKYSKYLPFVFTEHGVAMLSSVLKSERAIHVNIEIIRTFVELRGQLVDSEDFKSKLFKLENKFIQYDQKFITVFESIRRLIEDGKSINRKRIRPLGEK